VVAAIDPELLENLIDMDEIDAESVDDCTDESVMKYLESTQEKSESVTAEYVKAEVLAKVSFTMSEKDPALRVTKTVADYYSLHRNLRLDFIIWLAEESCRASCVGNQAGCNRIIAPRQPQIAHAIGCRSRELSPKNLVFWYCFARCIFCIRDGFLRDL
jgi:hypothetical protein